MLVHHLRAKRKDLSGKLRNFLVENNKIKNQKRKRLDDNNKYFES